MNKTNLLLIAILALSLFSISSASASLDPQVACEDADLVIPVNLNVVGVDCHNSNKTLDSIAIQVPSSGEYTIKGIVERGKLGQKQKNEAFFLEILGSKGPTAEDDAGEDAITSRLDFLGIFNLPSGSVNVEMKTSSICPPDTDANSVDLTYICLYKENNETPDSLFLNIISPRERTYDDKDITIELDSNGNLSFSFNDGKTNETYTSEIEKRLSEGRHTLTAFAVRGSESITKSVDFKIDLDDDNGRSRSGSRISTRLQPYQYNSNLEVAPQIELPIINAQSPVKESRLSPWIIILIVLLAILVILIIALSAR